MENVNVLITGGAGYLGSVLTGHLLRLGHSVCVVDNFMYGQQSLNHLCGYDMLQVVEHDACDVLGMSNYIADADVVIPLAALVGMPACAKAKTAAYNVNMGAVEQLVKGLSANQLLIYPNTNSGYGRSPKDTMCTEETPVNPLSTYASTKANAEASVLELANGFSLRFATLFGVSPRMRTDLMVNDFVYRAVHDKALHVFEGEHRRNFLHVDDAAHAFAHVMEKFDRSKIEPGVYNAGNSALNMTKNKLVERIKMKINFCVATGDHGIDPDKRDYVVSNAKFEATGWKAVTGIDDGIDELVKCYQQPMTMQRWRNA